MGKESFYLFLNPIFQLFQGWFPRSNQGIQALGHGDSPFLHHKVRHLLDRGVDDHVGGLAIVTVGTFNFGIYRDVYHFVIPASNSEW